MKKISDKILWLQIAFIVGVLSAPTNAFAQVGGGTSGVNFGTIARNINDSIAELPGLLTSVSYLMGILLGVLGIMKVKDHVENPSQTPMKEGAVRIVAGGALFGLPIIFEAMSNTIGVSTEDVAPAPLNRATFNVN